jgi:GTP cyclohydrolase II
MIKRLADRHLRTKFGTFEEILFYDGRKESIALVMGEVAGGEEVLCRIHSHCIGAHVFNSTECMCREEMSATQALIERKGRGIIIWLDQEGKGNGHLALLLSIAFKREGANQADAYEKAGYSADARDYRPAAEILRELGITSVCLITDNRMKSDALRELGINVADTVSLTAMA